MFQLKNTTPASVGLFQDWCTSQHQQTCVIKTSFQFQLDGTLTPLSPMQPIQCGDYYFNGDIAQSLLFPDETQSPRHHAKIFLTHTQPTQTSWFSRCEISLLKQDEAFLWRQKSWTRRTLTQCRPVSMNVFEQSRMLVLKHFYKNAPVLKFHYPRFEYHMELKKYGKTPEIITPICDAITVILDLRILCFFHRISIACDFYDPEEGFLRVF